MLDDFILQFSFCLYLITLFFDQKNTLNFHFPVNYVDGLTLEAVFLSIRAPCTLRMYLHCGIPKHPTSILSCMYYKSVFFPSVVYYIAASVMWFCILYIFTFCTNQDAWPAGIGESTEDMPILHGLMVCYCFLFFVLLSVLVILQGWSLKEVPKQANPLRKLPNHSVKNWLLLVGTIMRLWAGLTDMRRAQRRSKRRGLAQCSLL